MRRKYSKVSHQFVSDYRQIPYFPIKKKKKKEGKIRQEVLPRRESKPRSMLVARSSETKRYINWIVTRQPALEGKNEFPSITESSSQPLAANYQLNCLPLDINLLTCPFLTSNQRLCRATCIPSTCHRSNNKPPLFTLKLSQKRLLKSFQPAKTMFYWMFKKKKKHFE